MKLYMYDLYFYLYVVMIYLCFIGLPYSYFYADSVQSEQAQKPADDDSDDIENNSSRENK